MSGHPDPEHVFDQTNGLGGTIDEPEAEGGSSARDRRRQLSISQALGYISTGHN